MPLIVSKKKELIGSVSEDQGNWKEIIAFEIDVPDDAQKWTLHITASVVVSRMQFRFRKDEQIMEWVFGTGTNSGWEQQLATDIIQGVAPGRHKISLDGIMGTAMRRRLIVMAWPEEVAGFAASLSTAAGRKSSTTKKAATKKAATKKAATKKAATKKAATKAPRKKTNVKRAAPGKKRVVKKKSK